MLRQNTGPATIAANRIDRPDRPGLVRAHRCSYAAVPAALSTPDAERLPCAGARPARQIEEEEVEASSRVDPRSSARRCCRRGDGRCAGHGRDADAVRVQCRRTSRVIVGGDMREHWRSTVVPPVKVRRCWATSARSVPPASVVTDYREIKGWETCGHVDDLG